MGSLQREEKDFVKVLVLVSGEIREAEMVIGGGGKDATAAFRMGRRSPL